MRWPASSFPGCRRIRELPPAEFPPLNAHVERHSCRQTRGRCHPCVARRTIRRFMPRVERQPRRDASPAEPRREPADRRNWKPRTGPRRSMVVGAIRADLVAEERGQRRLLGHEISHLATIAPQVVQLFLSVLWCRTELEQRIVLAKEHSEAMG